MCLIVVNFYTSIVPHFTNKYNNSTRYFRIFLWKTNQIRDFPSDFSARICDY